MKERHKKKKKKKKNFIEARKFFVRDKMLKVHF
jgi:hypothetical protein